MAKGLCFCVDPKVSAQTNMQSLAECQNVRKSVSNPNEANLKTYQAHLGGCLAGCESTPGGGHSSVGKSWACQSQSRQWDFSGVQSKERRSTGQGLVAGHKQKKFRRQCLSKVRVDEQGRRFAHKGDGGE